MSKNNFESFLSNKNNRGFIFFMIGVVCLYFYTKQKLKQSESNDSYSSLKSGYTTGGKETDTDTTTTVPETETPVNNTYISQAYGSEVITSSGRNFSFSGSPNLKLSFENGNITDATPGLVHGNPSRYNGKYCFYMIGYSYFNDNGDSNHVYEAFQNQYLTDGVYTIRRFDCDDDIQTLADFEAGISGYPIETGVNEFNAQLSEVNLIIRSGENSKVPGWLKISRALNFVENVPNRAFGKKIFAIESINRGDAPEKYHAKGVHTQMLFGSNSNQPNTFRCFEMRHLNLGEHYTDQEIRDSLRRWIYQYGLNHNTVITDQHPENAQAQYAEMAHRNALAYQGAFDLLKERNPSLTKRGMNMFGSYGGDDLFGLIYRKALAVMSKADLAKYLGEKVFSSWNEETGSFRNDIVAYYESGQHKTRGVNVSYYMYNNIFMIPYELVCANERVKIGTKTYQDEDNESDWFVFGWIGNQTRVTGEDGSQIGVEENGTGEIIKYANGEIWRYPSFNSMIGEHDTLGFWSTLLGRGIGLWDGGGTGYGKDKTKIDYYAPNAWPIKWRPTGGDWEDYQSGVNGAPLNTADGLKDTLYASVVDVTRAGYEDALKLEGYADVINYASYNSSRKNFVATPGQAGFHLNGFGVLNRGMLAFKDAFDQKAGLSLITQGAKGKAGVYYNGFLSADDYEDDVTLTHNGQTVNLGRVYGRQTVFRKF